MRYLLLISCCRPQALASLTVARYEKRRRSKLHPNIQVLRLYLNISCSFDEFISFLRRLTTRQRQSRFGVPNDMALILF